LTKLQAVAEKTTKNFGDYILPHPVGCYF